MARTRVSIDSNAVTNWTMNPSGTVSRWTRGLATEIKIEAGVITGAKANKARARVGGGSSFQRLKDSYFVRWNRSTPSVVIWHVSNDRHYAAHVFLGHGPSFAMPDKVLLVGKSQLVGRRLLAPGMWDRVKRRPAVTGYGGANYPMMAVTLVYARRGL